MSPKVVRGICAIAFCFIGMCAVNAQAYHQLHTSDFQAKPRAGNEIAYTNCTVDFSYQPVYNRGNYQLTFNVNLRMNKDQSWLDRSRIISEAMLADVLQHEQGHYNLAYMMQQEMISVFNRTRFGSNYEQQVHNIFAAIKKKYTQLNLDYDEDTAHMQDRKQQNSWNAYFQQQLGQNSRMAALEER
ncbi:DUF922 domain-containing protein [Mucilaginibacter sp. KACC 22063]|uniref:DUF922 domain-containing protein n=1 Tax=Mucilaginibacter sp. KACC 22063 TaxID=3025666 RepID=UPI0023672863|nr:DUF922 domain-containing protein [Mucilaginibacter sp. KACC 22063]WDF55062.1 DUF922 domain-containing protein [Mucilaginibacter sp. KACC 22063]